MTLAGFIVKRQEILQFVHRVFRGFDGDAFFFGTTDQVPSRLSHGHEELFFGKGRRIRNSEFGIRNAPRIWRHERQIPDVFGQEMKRRRSCMVYGEWCVGSREWRSEE